MVERVADDVFRIRIPLPGNPLKELNSWVICSRGEYLVIDTGFNQPECLDAMNAGLEELGVPMSKASFMLTHMHSDHTGLIARLATPETRVYFGRIDARVFDGGIDWKAIMRNAIRHGFDAVELETALRMHPGIKYRPETVPAFTLLDDGDIIQVGDWRLRAILTPGHTAGHICLYEPDHRVLVSGDHVLGDITPHIESWQDESNTLKDYLESLDRVSRLSVDIVLPGHRTPVYSLQARVAELIAHHRRRADESVSVLGDESLDSCQVAARMTWDIRCRSFEEFPITQKWFAVGETLAHLFYLESTGRISRVDDGTRIRFKRA